MQRFVERSRYAAGSEDFKDGSTLSGITQFGVIHDEEYSMQPDEQKRFEDLYDRHVRALILWGYAQRTIDAYSRAVRRVRDFFDCVPDRLSVEQLEVYFSSLVESHSWATVKVDRNGLQFFWQHILERDWSWVKIIRPPKIQTLPDILSVAEVDQVMATARKLRFRVFVLTTYSMGLRLSETLSLQVGDIDKDRRQIHIRRGKGHKDRFVPLPEVTYQGLQALWAKHRHPLFIFPNTSGSFEEIRNVTTSMTRRSTQKALRAILVDCGVKKRSRHTRCAIVSGPICTNRGSAYEIFRHSSAIAAPRRQHSTLA